jgi:diadenosine tetraphosphate (Ap4A) HIT family hydrolase
MKYTREINDGKPCDFCELTNNNWWIADSEYFYLVSNRAPYFTQTEENWHGLIISKSHIFGISEMTQKKWIDLHKFKKRVLDFFGKGLFFNRQGTTGQSMYHWHEHFTTDDQWMNEGIPQGRILHDKDITPETLISRLKLNL